MSPLSQVPRGFIFNPVSAEVGSQKWGPWGFGWAQHPWVGGGWEHPWVGTDGVQSFFEGINEMSLFAALCHPLPAGSEATTPFFAGLGDAHSARVTHCHPSLQLGTLLVEHCPTLQPHGAGGTHVAHHVVGPSLSLSPCLSPFLSPGRGILGPEQIFWRPPDNSALYLPPPWPPVPPNTLVSATALCCKFPWSNYVLIYDNPRRAVEGGECQASLEVARQGPVGLVPPVNFSVPVQCQR